MAWRNFFNNHKTTFSGIDSALKTAYRDGRKGKGSVDPLVDIAIVARKGHHSDILGKIEESSQKIIETNNQKDHFYKEFVDKFWTSHKKIFQITGLVEALALTRSRKSDIIVWVLLALEGIYGYWLFKEILGDESFANTIMSALVGGMVIFISWLLTKIPEIFEDNYFKYIYGILSALFAAVFVYFLAQERGASVDAVVSFDNMREGLAIKDTSSFLFALSLLCTLLFGTALFSVLSREPRRLYEAKKFIAAYTPVLVKENELTRLNTERSKLESSLKKLENLSDHDIKTLVCQAYSEGLSSSFQTSKKHIMRIELEEKMKIESLKRTSTNLVGGHA